MKESSGIISRLNQFRKIELEDLCSVLGTDLRPTVRKSDLVQKLFCYLKEKPRLWLSHLSERDLSLLKGLVNKGPGKFVLTEVPDYISFPEVMGLVEYDDSDENFHKVWITREVYDIVAPCIDEVMLEAEKNGQFLCERIIIGYLNIYGILPFTEFSEIMMNWWDTSYPGESYDRLREILDRCPVMKLCLFVHDGKQYMFSPCISDEADEVFRLREESGIPDRDYPMHFTADQAVEAGIDAPYFTVALKTPQGSALVDVLKRAGFGGMALIRVLHDIWLDSQLPGDRQYIFDFLSSKGEVLRNPRLLDDCLNAVIAYANSVPRWALNGYSSDEKNGLYALSFPSEIFEEGEYEDPFEGEIPKWEMPKPTITKGFGNPEALDLLMAVPHVAPDDPCPCGSGLRYRSCHGKYQN